MTVNGRTTSSRQLAARWSTATGVLMSALSICRHLLHRGLRDHDGRIRVRSYASERCFPECVIKRHSGRTPGVIVWGAISYHGRSNLLPIEGNLNNNRYVSDVLQPEVVSFLQGILGASFSKIMHAHMLQRLFENSVQLITCNFFLDLLIHRI
ncbi:hypothetical protein TNCV_3998861 [Trichonephila clavipes]|nr:hypothetical protein TNCV_3998861 [Trichonephila clavipes]